MKYRPGRLTFKVDALWRGSIVLDPHTLARSTPSEADCVSSDGADQDQDRDQAQDALPAAWKYMLPSQVRRVSRGNAQLSLQKIIELCAVKVDASASA